MPKFEKNPNPDTYNFIIDSEDFYLSYNPTTGVNPSNPGATMIAELMSSLTGNKNGEEETALYSKLHGTWFILKGDFRAEYEDAFDGGFDACIEVYKRNIAHRSGWSTDWPPNEVQ